MMLCGSLAAQVQMALGLFEDPVQKKTIVEMDAAKQGIDLLEMLEEKTRGNLDDEEKALLSNLLTQLRLLYVEVAKARREPSPAESQDDDGSPRGRRRGRGSPGPDSSPTAPRSGR
jgi:hypothetical protein